MQKGLRFLRPERFAFEEGIQIVTHPYSAGTIGEGFPQVSAPAQMATGGGSAATVRSKG